VSLNASNAAQHKLATGSDSWDIVLDGIRSALAAGLNCGISAVISRANVGEIPAIIDFAGELGVKFVNLVNLLPHDDPGFLENVITNRSVDALASIEAAKTHLGSDVVKVWPMPVDIDGTNPMRCLSPFQRLGIDVKGNITGCCRVAPPKPENGSVQWEDVWNLPYLVNLRLALTGDRPLPDKCKYCFGNWVG
jgi:MoaA/NifB/PqqE/SkfB family radical SAM enzyme